MMEDGARLPKCAVKTAATWRGARGDGRAYAKMTAVTLDEDFDKPADVVLGHVSLADFIAAAWVCAAHA
ncbi:hypothetical protein [Ralstonia pickettii]|uniref:hypothetical protein n=1 Tax=Ralstonia pickettii TaxID=329 RepID=UPI001F270FB8|nr:hypothetical protein [Ralstonia pickettii]